MTRQALSATIDGVSTNLYAYDVFGNLTNEVQNGTVIARDYDTFGRPTGYALGGFAPSREVHYAYDALGRFASVTAGGSGDVPRPLSTFAYSYLHGTDLGEWCLSPFLHVDCEDYPKALLEDLRKDAASKCALARETAPRVIEKIQEIDAKFEVIKSCK